MVEKTSHDLSEMTATECYSHILEWHRKEGTRMVRERMAKGAGDPTRHSDWDSRYLAILGKLPSPSDANPEDMALLFREVISGSFEWAYHQSDSHGIEIHEYAHRGREIVKADPQGSSLQPLTY